MPLDLLIPFGILIVLVVYLIYTRNNYEKKIVNIYEEKFEEWKKHNASNTEEKVDYKELVGLVFKENGKIDVELFDEKYSHRLEKGKFNIKVK